MHNAGNRACRNLTCDVEMVAEKDGKITPAASFEMDGPAAQQRSSADVVLTLPALEPGHYQMRLTLRENGPDRRPELLRYVCTGTRRC